MVCCVLDTWFVHCSVLRAILLVFSERAQPLSADPATVHSTRLVQY